MDSLFTPLVINNIFLPNRLVMSPMALDQGSEEGEVTPAVLEHYAGRAKACAPALILEEIGGRAGLGTIIAEHAYVSPNAKSHPKQLGIYDDHLLPGLKELARTIQEEGVIAGIQISHGGARAINFPLAPSSAISPHLSRFGQKNNLGEKAHELTEREINQIIKDFAQAARRAIEAGFDFIEIHGAHGYLLNQFCSPLTNERQDEYGGTLEKRLSLPLKIIEEVKKTIGKENPLFYRLGADDRIDGGNTIKEGIQMALMLEEAGVDCLDLSGGIGGYVKNGPQGFFIYMAEAIKPAVNIPVMVTGGIKEGSYAHRLIARGQTDLVGVGRSLLKDPEWGKKAWLEICEL